MALFSNSIGDFKMKTVASIKDYLIDLYDSTENEDILYLLNTFEESIPFIEDSFNRGYDDVWIIDQLLTYATRLDGEFSNARDYD